MSKLFIATDIHGSAYWAERCIEKYRKIGADRLILLGDIYNHGPRNPFPRDYAPMRVADMLNALSPKPIVIRGNCDSEVDEMISDFEFLRAEILPWGKRSLFFTHGHVYNKNNTPKLSQGDVMFYGHFHVSEITQSGGITCVNVGSCALPKDGKNVYCTVADTGITILDFDDNVVCQKTF